MFKRKPWQELLQQRDEKIKALNIEIKEYEKAFNDKQRQVDVLLEENKYYKQKEQNG